MSNELVHVTVNGNVINSTTEHPFYVPKKGWAAAIEFRAGDVLVALNGELAVVESVQHEILEAPVAAYNFEVEDDHTYFVGDVGVAVHNRCNISLLTPNDIIFSDSQIGNKWGKHKLDYPELNSYKEYTQKAVGILTSYDSVVFDAINSEFYYIKGVIY